MALADLFRNAGRKAQELLPPPTTAEPSASPAVSRGSRPPSQDAGQLPSFNQPGRWGYGNEPRMPAPTSPPIGIDMPGGWGRSRDSFENPGQIPGTGGGSPYAGQGGFRDWFLSQVNGKEYSQKTLEDLQDLLRASGSALTGPNAQGERSKIWDPDLNDWVRVFGVEPGWGSVWNAQGYNRDGTPKAGSGGGGVFSDPATREWEQLLRTINERLQKPQPTYTDAQRELMQTQAIDPLERQRQAQKQNTTERFAARGINPGSGILEQALQDVDRQFDQMKTGQQSQFALNQIGREDQLFNSNEQRALAGLNLFSQIPQLADKRLGMAQQSLIPSNPYQLLSLQNQINQQGQYQQNYNQQQDQAFWSWLGQMLAKSFGR